MKVDRFAPFGMFVMRTGYRDDLEILRVTLTRMGGAAEDQLARALEALIRRHPALAAEVIVGDEQLDAIEAEIDEATVRILALRQPLAVDLREVVASIKIASTIERIGDLAKNIARRAQVLAEVDHHRSVTSVARMGRQVRDQVSAALDALIRRDLQSARRVWEQDINIDELYNSLASELMDEMRDNADSLTFGVQMMFVAKNLERIGDHATFIAEMTHFIISGETLPLQRPKGVGVNGKY